VGEVAIVGIGMHAFGRHEGVSGLEQGAVAVRRACADAGLGWKDIPFAVGGSRDGGHPDRLVSLLGLTGLPFLNVQNGCATGGAALITAYNLIRAGAHDLGVAVGFDKHPRGAFVPSTTASGERDWYGGSGLALTTQFFAMKINRYMEQYGISQRSLARVSAKAFRNGAQNPMAWRRRPLDEEEILAAPMLSYPLTQYMFCSPGEGAVALVLCRADQARRYTRTPIFLKAAVVRSRRFGSFEVLAPSLALEEGEGPTIDASRAAFEPVSVRRTSTLPNSRIPSPVQRSCTWPKMVSVPMGNRRRCWPRGRRRSAVGFPSTPTVAAWPTANPSEHRDCDRSTRTSSNSAAMQDHARSRTSPGWPTPMSTDPRGSAV
jgi:acetyl-CoA C-acetyltransferase